MKKTLIPALRLLVVLSMLTGVVYPLCVTLIGQIFFRTQANGSLISKGDQVIGSELLAQEFKSEKYFWSRPSAVNYHTIPGGASNLGPTSQKLRDRVDADIARLKVDLQAKIIPYDLIFTSGSGLDPHVTPQSAKFQAARIAEQRKLTLEQVNTLIDQHTEGPTLGLIGRPRVNVLKLNLALDALRI